VWESLAWALVWASVLKGESGPELVRELGPESVRV
jgi:hypothetical protein